MSRIVQCVKRALIIVTGWPGSVQIKVYCDWKYRIHKNSNCLQNVKYGVMKANY